MTLTHLDADGSAHMVDVGAKAVTQRQATATGRITLSDDALAAGALAPTIDARDAAVRARASVARARPGRATRVDEDFVMVSSSRHEGRWGFRRRAVVTRAAR